MKKLLLLFVMLSAMADQHSCLAQNNGSISLTTRIDSLKNELIKAKEDTSALKILINLGNALMLVNDYEHVPQYSRQAIILADKLLSESSAKNKIEYTNRCRKLKADAIGLTGIVFYEQGDFIEALKNQFAALKIDEEIGEEKDIAGRYNEIGNIYTQQGDYAEALKNQLAALKVFEKIGDKQNVANLYNNIGAIHEYQGNYIEALKDHLAALKIREEIGDKKGLAQSYGNTANVYEAQGNYAEALKNHSTASAIYAEAGNLQGIGISHFSIGAILYEQGDYTEALKNLLSALKLFEDIGDKTGIASTYGMMANIYSEQGNYTEALENNSASLKIFQELGDTRNIAISYNNIAVIYGEQGSYTQELKNHSAALKIQQDIGDKRGCAISYNNIGSIYAEHGNYAEAFKNISTSLKIDEDLQDKKGIAESYNSMSSLYMEMTYTIKGISADSVNALCSIAISCNEKALILAGELNAKHDMYNALSGLGDAFLSLNKYDDALYYYTRARDLADSLHLKKGLAKAFQNISNLYSEKGQYNNALSYCRQSFEAIKLFLSENFNSLTENEKCSFKNSVIKNSDAYFTNAFLGRNNPDDSWQWLYNYQLFQRGIILESSSGLAASVQKDTLLKQLWKKFSGYKTVLGKEYLKPGDERREDVAALEDSANNLEKELLFRSLPYRNWKERVNTTWKNVQNHLAKDEAAVELVSFHLQREQETDSVLYAAMILTPEMKHPKLLFLFEEKPLASLLKNTAMRGMKLEIAPANSLQHGDSLYKLIFQPLLPYLRNIKTISFATDGLMHKINLASISGPNGKPLCETYKLKQMASTRSIVFPSPEPAQQPAAFFGGIDYTYQPPNRTLASSDSTTSLSLIDLASRTRGGEFDFLPGSKLEAEDLGNLYKTKKFSYRLIEGKLASEKTFKQMEGNSPSVLHIATHGFFFPEPVKKKNYDPTGESSYTLAEDPLLRSGLLLAGGNYTWEKGTNPYEEEDGILTAYEISHLNLSTTDLVVLSACETGLGDIKGSEGVYGLQRAFKMAGVKYIIMSLWQLPDKETREFMMTFYNKWLGGEKIRSAFQDTQREMSKKYDPYKWAAFVLVE